MRVLPFTKLLKTLRFKGGDSKGDGTGDPGYSVKGEI